MGDGGEDSVLSKTSTSTEKGVDASTPYSLHASDNPGAMITSVTLTGENYNEWSSEMTNALRAKRKLGFIEGTIPKPLASDPNHELWLSVNSMIVGWIRTSIESRVRSTVIFCSRRAQVVGEPPEAFFGWEQGSCSSLEGTDGGLSSRWLVSY